MLITFPETKIIEKKDKTNLPKFVRLGSGRSASSARPVPKKGTLITFPETKIIRKKTKKLTRLGSGHSASSRS